MSTALSAVTGIGPSTVKDLEQCGIRSAEDLANASLSEIQAVPGFAEARAINVKEAAIALIRSTSSPAEKGKSSSTKPKPATEPADSNTEDETISVTNEEKESSKADKKDKKAKKKKKKKKKDKKAKKDKKKGKKKDKEIT